jgi:hypothetical protein
LNSAAVAEGNAVDERMETETQQAHEQSQDVSSLGSPMEKMLRQGGTGEADDNEPDSRPTSLHRRFRQDAQDDQAADRDEYEAVEDAEQNVSAIGEAVCQRA